MDHLFSDFSQPSSTAANGHEHATSVTEDAHHLEEQQQTPTVDVVNDAIGDPSNPASEQEQPLRGKAATHGLSVEEKKERQKQQNRRAAERSRNKKREELTALEMTVNNIQDENQRLRSCLATLLASKPDDTTPQAPNDPETTSHPSTGGIDYTRLAKLQSELATAKVTLLEREMELARVQGDDQTSNNYDVRNLLLSHTTSLHNAQSEVKVLHSAIGHIRTERDSLARQRDLLARELDARRTLREAANDSPPTNSMAAGVERALLELRGLVDGTIKTWEQVRKKTRIR